MWVLLVAVLATAGADSVSPDGIGDGFDTPGDALELAPSARPPGARPRDPEPAVVSPTIAPRPRPDSPGVGGGWLPITAIMALGAGVVRDPRRRDDPPVGLVPSDIHLVFVPGHGGDLEGTFFSLIAQLGLTPDRSSIFDYQWTDAADDHLSASRVAHVDAAATALNGFVAGLASAHDRIYLVGHSKGAVAIAELLARADGDPDRLGADVVGAMLLDPPMAPGVLGHLQGIGRWIVDLPDNGGFHPITCTWDGCRDVRAGLGRGAGVEVVVIRNPDAAATAFRDLPPELRVYDVVDGYRSAWSRLPDVGGVIDRMGEAHSSVLWSPFVAACLAAELRDRGSCEWRGDRRPRGRLWWGSGDGPNVKR